MKYTPLLLVVLVVAVSGEQQYGRDYFQYANVKGPKEYAHGYSRGNAHHYRTHHQRNKDHTFQAKVTWGDLSGGHGEHYFEYNHAPKPTGYAKATAYTARSSERAPYGRQVSVRPAPSYAVLRR